LGFEAQAAIETVAVAISARRKALLVLKLVTMEGVSLGFCLAPKRAGGSL